MSKKDRDGGGAANTNLNTLDDEDLPKIKYNNDIREIRSLR